MVKRLKLLIYTCNECKRAYVGSKVKNNKYPMVCGSHANKQIKNFPNIPDWCPLEDAEE